MTEDLIKKLENLARMGLTSDEEKKLREDLQEILDYMRMLDEVDVSGIDPMYTPVEWKAPMRSPEVREFDSEKVRRNFPEREGNHLIVPPILG